MPVDQASESLLKSKACFGAENLMRVLGNYCRLGEVRTHIRVGVVGKASGEVMGPRLLPCAGASLGERILGTSCYFWLGRRGAVQEGSFFLRYLFWQHWIFVAAWAISHCGKWGLLISCSAWVSHYGGFSYCGAWALGCAGFCSGSSHGLRCMESSWIGRQILTHCATKEVPGRLL